MDQLKKMGLICGFVFAFVMLGHTFAMADVDQVKAAGGKNNFFSAEFFGHSRQIVKFDDFIGDSLLKMI